MATDAENLATIKSNYLAELATESAAPRVTYNVNGQSFSWNEYRASLLEAIKEIDALLASTAGPFEVRSEVL